MGEATDTLRVGLDIGSTTVKAVVLGDSDRLEDALFSDYRRHHANVRKATADLLTDVKATLAAKGMEHRPIRFAITGSGGLELANQLGCEFIQEVIAETDAINVTYPDADVIIELGGEDAKITYLKPVPEQRMNGSCAGGTGAFIDQMATLLNTDAPGLNELAKQYKTLYPIASRCGVFAKSDLQPLINDGADKEDLAASIFQAVATQTIAGLACGRPVKGNIVFLGGPLFFMSELREAFKRILEGKASEYIVPENAHLYVAYGAALEAGESSKATVERTAGVEGNPLSEDVNDPFGPAFCMLEDMKDGLATLKVRRHGDDAADDASAAASRDADAQHAASAAAAADPLHFANEASQTLSEVETQGHFDLSTLDGVLDALDSLKNRPNTARTIRPLFLNDDERREFDERHARQKIAVGNLDGAHGPHFLGIDAGSTTIKATLINDDKTIVWSSYATHKENPLLAAADIVRAITAAMPDGAYIARACATGYGEGLITAGLHIDEGVVETMAHYRAAEEISPGVTAVIDIGGQDMKYMDVNDGVIDSICVNEACSSGCGSFLQTFAQSLGLTIQQFTQEALASKAPADLGSRCTVFMNSAVKQAQKEGASPEDIAAGLCYSVVRNALYKVIKLRDANALGPVVVVQGGTFLNDAVLRAFELLTGRKVTRPNIAGLMGAYGAALTARMHCPAESEADAAAGTEAAHPVSTMLTGDALDHLSMTTTHDVCKLCQNHCKLTITEFEDGTRYVTGNRCERGGDKTKKRSDRPNLYDFKYKRAFAYRRLTPAKATRGDIGIPRVLNMYEDYPFWFTLLTNLGFRVIISGRSDHKLFEEGMDSIASENICYPAKLVHGHIRDLVAKGVKRIFYPCVSYEQQLVPDTQNRYNCPIVANYPVVIEANMPELAAEGVRFMRPYFNLANKDKMVDRIVEVFADDGVTREEAELAVTAAYREDAVFKNDVKQEGLRALAYMQEHRVRGVVLAGRPYHIDPEVNHGIPETICALGMAVLSEDSVCELDPHHMPRITEYLNDDKAQRALEANREADGFRKTVPAFDADHKMPLRVFNQWAYHSRLYEAARFVSEYPNLQLVQLVSFGCGVDAITTDQVQEILADKGDVYTQLKIDEVSNLGAAKIRLRSLKAAMEERDRRNDLALGAGVTAMPTKRDGSAPDGSGREAGKTTGWVRTSREPFDQAIIDTSAKPRHPLAGQFAPVDAAQTGAGANLDAITADIVAKGMTSEHVSLDEAKATIAELAGFVARHDATASSGIAVGKREDVMSHGCPASAFDDAAQSDDAEAKRKPASSADIKPSLSKYKTLHPFTKAMAHTYTVLAPQMSPVHFSLLKSVFTSGHYNFELLTHATQEDIETGVKYVNNDACFPAIIVVGQLVNAFLTGKYDPHRCALVITQTGGMCRATNYLALLRKALADAGYDYVPIIALSVQGFNDNPGFKATPALAHRAVKVFYLGDILSQLLLRVRPYEAEPGSANRLYRVWDTITRETIEHHGWSATYQKLYHRPGYLPYGRLIRRMTEAFDKLPLRDIPRKPRVGVVGEILVKYHPDANNHVVDLIEEQGCEAVLPGICDFMLNGIYSADWNEDHLGTGGNLKMNHLIRRIADLYRRPMVKAFEASHGKFEVPWPVDKLRDKAATVTSIGVQAGEGWLLTGEIVELIETGAPNVVCAQPFACLPNHVTGRGMFGKIRRVYPEANIVSIDYDPGASEANQLNRLKLMIAAAKKNITKAD
ncbi:2-hydroxyglutaryl-CoA dehydratase [Bifidobacterium sp. DSM 109958]|uniref:2-hydroxyglutaryl-CoA dehydratase n=1 Tax=Bifidobacterium moraviense TaxID=2675323 RepID=A0A7Y0F1H5_9BIFI|nr:acyl-CoA dehydratase activase-related protein [Bifidobacterium sp. DSM 109958]NMN00154.1 2-hydroxyglutaryl-CoA dehydratase [Bifidobacterium sp. DSM 109958]